MMLNHVIPRAGAEFRRASSVLHHARRLLAPQRRPLEMDRARMALPVAVPRATALPVTVPSTSRALQVERPHRISLNMAMKMEALTRAIAAEEVPKKAVLSETIGRISPCRPPMGCAWSDPDRSVNCPPGHVAHGRGVTSRRLLRTPPPQTASVPSTMLP